MSILMLLLVLEREKPRHHRSKTSVSRCSYCGNATRLYPKSVVNATSFVVPFENFSIVDDEGFLGKGHFSVVRKARLESGLDVAVKELRIFNRRTLIRELAILKTIEQINNTVKLIGITGDNARPTVIYSYHRSSPNTYTNISMSDFRWWLQTLLETVAVLHEAGILHRDIKLGNVVTDFDTRQLAIIDFGLSDFHQPGVRTNPRTGCFRLKAPELAIEVPYHNCACDMWAIGIACLDLMIGMRQTWTARNNEILREQLVQAFGTKSWNDFVSKYDWQYMVPYDSEGDIFQWAMPGTYHLVTNETLDLVAKLLVLDPVDRISARDALKHRFFVDE